MVRWMVYQSSQEEDGVGRPPGRKLRQQLMLQTQGRISSLKNLSFSLLAYRIRITHIIDGNFLYLKSTEYSIHVNHIDNIAL